MTNPTPPSSTPMSDEHSDELDKFMESIGYHFEAAHPDDCECHELGSDTTVDGYWKDGDMIPADKMRQAFADILAHHTKEAVLKAWIEAEQNMHDSLEYAKGMVVKYSDEPGKGLGIGWVISGIDRMAYDSSQRLLAFRAELAAAEQKRGV